MTVISVPVRLRFAVAALYLCIPLIAVEVIIATRAPWWRLPYKNIGYWSLAFGLICVPLSAWLVGAKRWAYPIVCGLSLIWVFASAWVAIRMKYPALGFYALFLLGFFLLELPWLKHELERSFFDPQLAWYQGLPKPIPGLSCHIAAGERAVDLKVSRIDRDGVFVFAPSEGGQSSIVLSSLLERRKLEMLFQFRERQMSCEGIPILSVAKGAGAGIQFVNVSPDQQKEMGDFVELLRGEGYV